MDIQKAIDKLSNCKYCVYKKEGKCADTDECLGAKATAISALKKQIPYPLDYEADGYSDGKLAYDVARCPECGHEFEYNINDWGSEFCPDCGQHLDWSGADE